MRRVGQCVLFLGLAALSAKFAWAEAGAAPPSSGTSSPQATGGSPSVPSRGIKVFDDKVFELSFEKKQETTKGGPGGRSLAEEPDYNSAQREEWIQNCQAAQAKSAEAYRECYAKQKAGNREKVRRQFDSVERGQGQPTKTAPPLMEETLPGQPAFRGVDIEEVK